MTQDLRTIVKFLIQVLTFIYERILAQDEKEDTDGTQDKSLPCDDSRS